MRTYRFGAFTLSVANRELRCDGAPVAIGRRAFDVLAYLIERAGRIVPQSTLIDAVWNGRQIQQNNLTVQMSQIRRILRSDNSARPMIRTLAGDGYMFVGDVTAAGEPDPVAAPASRVSHATTSFVGRAIEQQDLRDRVRQHRLVTVAGIGGIGKTRLALRVADDMADRFADGVRQVDLTPITDQSWLASALATAVGAGAGDDAAEAALIKALRGRELLLILDNAEHLIAPLRPLLTSVLAACPRVSMLVTSRECLGLPDESPFRLQPLRAPTHSKGNSAALLEYDAVLLFVERAAALMPAIRADAAMLADVAEICRRLDGIALAIEMAATRLKLLTPREIAERLDDRFRLLPLLDSNAPPRQHTLREMFDWSWELLRPDQAALLQRLAAFAGSASLHALVTLSNTDGVGEWEVLEQLDALVDKSLVVRDVAASAPRYRLLETTRIYALERLGAASLRSLRCAHAAFIAGLFEQAEDEWPITADAVWVDRYGPDADNMRQALEWAFGPDGDVALALRLVAATCSLWWTLPGLPLREGRVWFERAIDRLTPETLASVAARLWLGRSWRDARFGDRENYPAAAQAVAMFRRTNDPIGLGAALYRAGNTMLTHETADQADELLRESAAILRTQPPNKFLVLCLVKQADLLLRQGRFEQSLDRYEEAMRIIRSIGHWYGLMTCASNMADLLLLRGEQERALRQLHETRQQLPRELRSPHVATFAAHLALAGRTADAYEAAREVAIYATAAGLTGAVGWIAETLGLLRVWAGDVRLAARLAGFARRIHPSIATRAGARREVFVQLDAALRAALAEPERTELLREGAAWADEEAADAITDSATGT
jgi:predicted ATPase